MKKIVLKVSIYSQKHKTKLLQAAAKLPGVNEVSIDEEKGTLTVIGTVDPVCLAAQLRKKAKVAEIMSVRPHKPKKKDSPKAQPCLPPCYCQRCQFAGVAYAPREDQFCSIL